MAPAGRSLGSFGSAPRNFCKTNKGPAGPRSSRAEAHTKSPLLSHPVTPARPPRFPPGPAHRAIFSTSIPAPPAPNRCRFKLAAHAQCGPPLHPYWPLPSTNPTHCRCQAPPLAPPGSSSALRRPRAPAGCMSVECTAGPGGAMQGFAQIICTGSHEGRSRPSSLVAFYNAAEQERGTDVICTVSCKAFNSPQPQTDGFEAWTEG